MANAAVARLDVGKPQVVDRVPKVIKELRFGVLKPQDIVNQAVVEISDRKLFDLEAGRTLLRNGPLDTRLGVANKKSKCETCKELLEHCSGHFGNVKLCLPVFHVGYFKKVIQILQCICKDCSRILLSDMDYEKFTGEVSRADDGTKLSVIARRVLEQCKKTKTCFQCGTINGVVRKAGTVSLKISHDKFRSFNSSVSKSKVAPPEKIAFDKSFEEAKRKTRDVEKLLNKAQDDINPLRAMKIFRRVVDSDCPLLGLRTSRPEDFLWTQIPAPPVCLRPSVGTDGGTSNEDDITNKLGDIVGANASLKTSIVKGAPVTTIMEHWDFLSLQVALYINSDIPGLAKGDYGKQLRSFVQRLKGKQGRFRGNLSGKRVDFSGRTVISPDPNLNIDEVAVPLLVAKNMTYPEVVTSHNIEKLRARINNGVSKWPGANLILKRDSGFKQNPKYNKEKLASDLKIGDTVERHLEDGDIVLFNRQPSLHKLSILSHRVKVRPHRTFRLNECVCNPYNADFDGDEMNLHVPQTEEARIEATQLMGVKHNIVTPKDGTPLISAIQDFITASYLLSSLDQFYDRQTFTGICLGMLDNKTKFKLPLPSIVKPQMMWTGKQVFNVLMRPNNGLGVLVNVDARCRGYSTKNQNEVNDLQWDQYLVVRNSEIMCGVMDKSTLGSGKKDSIMYAMYRDYGPDAAAQGMTRLSKLCARWLGQQAFSIGISDVTPPQKVVEITAEERAKSKAICGDLLRAFKAGNLDRLPGMDLAGTLENETLRELNKTRTVVGDRILPILSRRNAALVMAESGSKGSKNNVTQMTAMLGQQDIEGKRVQDGFQDRSLPHFLKQKKTPASKGYIENSFFSGLLPYEFIFHAVSGRVGLVDTAVKTAETGYMSRRLMKSLEDLSNQYDRTVRNSQQTIVQFVFGDDELDPVDMEAETQPVNFQRTLAHADAITYDSHDKGLTPKEVQEALESRLAPERAKLTRWSEDGKTELPYILADQDSSITNRYKTPQSSLDIERTVDRHDSSRKFIANIEDFLKAKTSAYERTIKDKKTTTTEMTAAPLATIKNSVTPAKRGRPAKGSLRSVSRKSAKTSRYQTANSSGAGDDEETSVMLASPSTRNRFDLTSKISVKTLEAFLSSCFDKYKKATTEPGHAVGAVGAQSIGEPGTQMTLKTFHFSGVAGMSITAGVPRIKEIINASKSISTPIVSIQIERQRKDGTIPQALARVVKGRIEALYLRDLIKGTRVGYDEGQPSSYEIAISQQSIGDLMLDITLTDIIEKIRTHRRFKTLDLNIFPQDGIIYIPLEKPMAETKKRRAVTSEVKTKKAPTEPLAQLQYLRQHLPAIHLLGHAQARRGIISSVKDPLPKRKGGASATKDIISANKQYDKKPPPRAASMSTSKQSTPVLVGDITAPGEDVTMSAEIEITQKRTRGRPNRSVKRQPSDIAIKSEEPEGSSVLEEPSPEGALVGVQSEAGDKKREEDAQGRAKEIFDIHDIKMEGYGLQYILNTPGVAFTKTETNSVIETLEVLGIEAARGKIISEIKEVTGSLGIDPRHMMLLADVMTFKGEVLGITRFGLAKMRDSVLQLASFEKTADHVFDAGVAGKGDKIEGVSECVIVGKTMGLGTGSVNIVTPLRWVESDWQRGPNVFEDYWKAAQGEKRKIDKGKKVVTNGVIAL